MMTPSTIISKEFKGYEKHCCANCHVCPALSFPPPLHLTHHHTLLTQTEGETRLTQPGCLAGAALSRAGFTQHQKNQTETRITFKSLTGIHKQKKKKKKKSGGGDY